MWCIQFIVLQVTKVHSSDNTVVLSTESGDNIEADYVVVTLPLSLLKQRAITFSPELPDSKLQAINKLGVGVLEKVRMATFVSNKYKI